VKSKRSASKDGGGVDWQALMYQLQESPYLNTSLTALLAYAGSLLTVPGRLRDSLSEAMTALEKTFSQVLPGGEAVN